MVDIHMQDNVQYMQSVNRSTAGSGKRGRRDLIMKKERIKNITLFVAGLAAGIGICTGGFNITDTADAALADIYPSRFPLYINRYETPMNEAFIKDGRTYVQLREFCEATNIRVDWVEHHPLPIQGGAMDVGVHLTVPSYIYVYDVTNWMDGNKQVKSVDMTYMIDKYKYDGKLAYSFDDYGDTFVIKTGETEERISIDTFNNMGRDFISVEQFKEKILPYMVEICMQ